MKLKSISLKYTYTLCTIASFVSVYLITANEDIGESMRLDDYSMGTAYYVLLFSAGLMSSAFVVVLSQWPETIYKKFSVWIKSIFITVGIFIAGLLLFALAFGISMSTSHWSFG